MSSYLTSFPPPGISYLAQMDQMCEGIAKQHGEGKPTNILLAFRCLAVDTITSFCFAKPANALAAPDFQAPIERAMTLSLPMVTFIKYFPAIKTFVAHCPPLLVSLLKPGLIGLVNMRKVCESVNRNPTSFIVRIWIMM